MTIDKEKRYIIRCDRAGVFFAHVSEYDPQTATATLTDCRRLWYWDGAASISQIAMEGVKNPDNCNFTITVPEMIVGGVIELIPCTAAAEKSIDGVKVWKR